MKKFLKIPTTGAQGTVYLDVLGIVFCKPLTATTTNLVTKKDNGIVTITLEHASETDNATTRWWYENLTLIIRAPYEEVMFDATTPPFEISAILYG